MKAVAKIAWMAALAGVLGAGARAQQGVEMGQSPAPLRLKQLSVAQMPEADRSLFESSRGRLARAARLFGYQMQEPGWACREVMTKDTPDYLMVICERPGSGMRSGMDGAYVFSALIARSGEAVYVVPVMFGGAAPWKTAANMKAGREILNHVVPARIAAEAMKASGDWMELGMTYTALSGDDSVVLTGVSRHLKWLMAPEPTIVVRGASSKRWILFSDISPRGSVRIWNLTFNRQGRLLESKVTIRRDLKATRVSTKTPQGVVLKNLPSPVESAKPVPATQH
jgi:hypothetical protein